MEQAVPSGWSEADSALTRTIRCATFMDALALVVEIGRMAEAANHHPDIDIRYRTVYLRLSTHDAGHQVTSKDFALAHKINELHEADLRATGDKLRRHFES